MTRDAAVQNGVAAEQDFLASVVLGEGLPEEAEKLLRAAAASYDQDDVALRYLMEARLLAPTHPATLIGLYRFYFYKGRLKECLRVAEACLTRAAIDNSLPLDWRQVTPRDAAFGDFGAVLPRFFMFSLKGYAYLTMRLGEFDESAEAIDKLLQLDPADKIGAKVLLGVLERRGLEEDVD
jgi:tetratricopeptide (TPR) repeat protein